MSTVPRETYTQTWPDRVTDHMVSKEEFRLEYCPDRKLLRTQPFPSVERLPAYYESEDYLSHKDKDSSFFGRVYLGFRKWAIGKKVRLINQEMPTKGRLLDIGCGTGDFLSRAKNDGWEVLGVEPGEQARAFAKSKGLEIRPNWEDLDEGLFDVISLWHVLEHIPDLEKCCRQLERLLKPGGRLLIAVPNFRSWDAQHYGAYWAAFDVPRHLWHFSKESFKLLFDQSLEYKKDRPLYLDPFYVSLLSEKYRGSKLIWIKALIGGLRSLWYGWRKKEHSSHIYFLTKPNKPK